jgi:hypothetical protein
MVLMMLDDLMGCASLMRPDVETKLGQAFQEVWCEEQIAVVGIFLSERGFGLIDRFGAVALDVAAVAQGPSHAHYGYDLGRSVEVKLAWEGLFQVDGLAMEACGGEDARVEEWFVGKANEPKAHGVAKHDRYAWW